MAHPDLPRPPKFILKKAELAADLLSVDKDQDARQRILQMETEFRSAIATNLDSLPSGKSGFRKFKTSPFVLLMHCFKRGYHNVKQLELDILPAKEFSSMETSAGKMTEKITLPVYDWETVESKMHTVYSAIDGKQVDGKTLRLATLKSGPVCLNDEMSENFADAIIAGTKTWAQDHSVSEIDFTYGVLYGTKKQSNKKDWHILRNLMDKIDASSFEILPKERWDCRFEIDGVKINVSIKIGFDWWQFLGGNHGLIELLIALIRAAIIPSGDELSIQDFTISDLPQIIDTSVLPDNFNISLLQKSQLPWVFLMAYHFCDELKEK
jgi:hypothetical protein